jgi:hypothetical protein
MIKAALTLGSAAVLAALVTILPAPQVEAGPADAHFAAMTAQDTGLWREQAAIALAEAGCTQRAWPYYEQGCVTDFEARWRGEPRKVRLVTTDRLN